MSLIITTHDPDVDDVVESLADDGRLFGNQYDFLDGVLSRCLSRGLHVTAVATADGVEVKKATVH